MIGSSIARPLVPMQNRAVPDGFEPSDGEGPADACSQWREATETEMSMLAEEEELG